MISGPAWLKQINITAERERRPRLRPGSGSGSHLRRLGPSSVTACSSHGVQAGDGDGDGDNIFQQGIPLINPIGTVGKSSRKARKRVDIYIWK